MAFLICHPPVPVYCEYTSRKKQIMKWIGSIQSFCLFKYNSIDFFGHCPGFEYSAFQSKKRGISSQEISPKIVTIFKIVGLFTVLKNQFPSNKILNNFKHSFLVLENIYSLEIERNGYREKRSWMGKQYFSWREKKFL